MKKSLYIIAGCNGAGKTTASFSVLPGLLNIHEFVNADEIARGLSPFNPASVAIKAGKLMLQRIDELISQGQSLAIETTLASKTHIHLVRKAHQKGYVVNILFFYLKNVALARQRVKERVANGGHDIPSDVIERRYHAGMSNLFKLFLPEVDTWTIYDNSERGLKKIASGGRGMTAFVCDEKKYKDMRSYE